jgi:hypothetical protein
MKMAAFWVVVIALMTGAASPLKCQQISARQHGATQNPAIFILAALRT